MDPRLYPNLFIIGAAKSGTSSLHTYLSAHPDVFMCQPKEPSHFVERSQLRAVWPAMERRGYWDRTAYLALFRDAGDAAIVGESSANYARLRRVTGVAERIAAFNAEARLIYIMRDPVERTISHYWHCVGHEGERRTPLDALTQSADYCDVSYYAMQLQPYIRRFGRQRLLILTFEDLRDRTAQTVRQVFEWLGVDPAFVPGNLGQAENITPPLVTQARGLGLLSRLRRARVWGRISPRLPEGLKRFGRGMAERQVDRASVPMAGVVEYLRPLQLTQTQELSELLGRTFPDWHTLHGDC